MSNGIGVYRNYKWRSKDKSRSSLWAQVIAENEISDKRAGKATATTSAIEKEIIHK